MADCHHVVERRTAANVRETPGRSAAVVVLAPARHPGRRYVRVLSARIQWTQLSGKLVTSIRSAGRIARAWRSPLALWVNGRLTTRCTRPIVVCQDAAARTAHSRPLTQEDAQRHLARGRSAGDSVTILPITNGNHFDVIGPGRAVFPAVLSFIRQAMGLEK